MKKALALFAFAIPFWVTPLAAVPVQDAWVVPLRPTPRFDLPVFERTRPILLGDMLFVADLQGRVVALHRKLGFVLWETRVPGGVSGAFTYRRSKLYVGDRSGNLFALNTRDGSIAWQIHRQAEWLSPPAVIPGFVFALSSAGDLYALDESTGEERWHYDRRGEQKMHIWGSGGPAVFESADPEVYQGFSDGTMVALSAEKGRVLWETRLRHRERFHDIDMVPYVDAKRVITATFDGQLFSLDRLRGSIQWSYPVGSYSGFASDGQRVYYSGINRKIFAIDLESRQPVWNTPIDAGVGATPVLLNGKLLVPTSSDPLYILDPANGKVLQRVTLGAGALSAITGADDGLFHVLSNYGNVFSFQL